MKKTVDVFLVNTPRQWWISCAIALKQKQPALLIIEDSFNDADVFYDLTLAWKDTPFLDVILLFGKNSWHLQKNVFKRTFLKRSEVQRRFRQYQEVYKQFNFKQVYASNVGNWNVQYLLHLSKGGGQNAGCSYIDDGVISYVNYYDKPQIEMGLLQLLKRKAHYGWWFKKPLQTGLVDWVNKGYVLSVSRAKPSLKKIHLEELDGQFFNSVALESLGESLFNHYDFDLLKWKKEKNVIIFSKVSRLEKTCPGYSLFMKNMLLASECNSENIWIKYHPGEDGLDVLDIKSVLPEVKVIPRSIPFEILAFWMTDKDKISGDVSTVLMDVKLQNNRIHTEVFICKNAYLELVQLYRSIGIKINYF